LIQLEDLGWNDFFATQVSTEERSHYTFFRVSEEHKNLYLIVSDFGEFWAEVSGKLRHEAYSRADFPAVGDWVCVQTRRGQERATIHRVLKRKTKFSRQAAGGAVDEQIVAANVDVAFLVTSLNRDLNPRRLERALILVWESGATPVIILNKADLCPDADAIAQQIAAAMSGVDVHVVSALENHGLENLKPYLTRGKTAVLFGSSGVGKSTLVNALAGRQLLEVQAIREDDDRGRHTTTHRQLIRLPNGGMIIDTPGVREIQLWDGEEGIGQAFDDIEQLAQSCRFKDCEHKTEPGCAIKLALQDGTLELDRYQSYLTLQREVAFHANRQAHAERLGDRKRRMNSKTRFKQLSVANRRAQHED
jgi:ribosome biogenesis GTPase